MKQQFTANIFLYHTILSGISDRKGLCRLFLNAEHNIDEALLHRRFLFLVSLQ